MRSLLAFALALSLASASRAGEITVSAAVSLKEALTDVAAAYEKRSGGEHVNLNFGATGHLLAQIRDGAPVDGFVSAAEMHMDQAAAEKLVDADSRAVIAGNRLVLIVPPDADRAAVTGFRSLGGTAVKRVAIGQPKTVPAGQYAEQVLKHLGVMESVRRRIVFGASVRQVLDYVERGEVDAGIVYETDAKESGDRVRVVAAAEPGWHDPILYSVATVAGSGQKDAMRAFAAFLHDESVRAMLRERGFSIPRPATRPARPAPEKAGET